jgi:hypothetical protein
VPNHVLHVTASAIWTALACVCWAGCAVAPPAACVIDAASVGVAIIGRDSPLADAGAPPANVVAITNRDLRDWQQVEVALHGFEVTTERARHATGRYASPESKAAPRGARVTYELGRFENSRGGKWMPNTMQPTEVQLTVMRDGVRCQGGVVVAGAVP